MTSIPSNGRPRRRSLAAATAAVALCSAALAGCGGSPKASGGGGGGGATSTTAPAPTPLPADQAQKPACGLVTQAEVEAAVGAKVAAGKQDTQPGRSLCSFALASATDQSVIIVSTSSSGVPANFEASRAKAASPQSITAGDQAFVTGGQALVRRGNTMVAVLVALRQAPAQLSAAATKLAQAVGARL